MHTRALCDDLQDVLSDPFALGITGTEWCRGIVNGDFGYWWSNLAVYISRCERSASQGYSSNANVLAKMPTELTKTTVGAFVYGELTARSAKLRAL